MAKKTEFEKNGGDQVSEIRNAMDIGLASIIQLDGDVCNNYRWSVNSVNQRYIDEVPKIILKEYQSSTGPILDGLKLFMETGKRTFQTVGQGLANIIAGAGVDHKPDTPKLNPYLEMYKGDHTGNIYNLPFFNGFNHAINNSWGVDGEMDMQKGLNKALEVMGSLGQVGTVEKRKVWTGSNPTSYSFGFTLYNTFDVDDILKNLLFVRGIMNNNLATRTSYATMLPPCFYKVDIPGVRYSPMAVIAALQIDNIGQVNRIPMSLPTGNGDFIVMDVNIPDAWSINITVNEMLTETRNILQSVYLPEGERVTVLPPDDDSKQANVSYQDVGGGGFA